MYGIYTDIYVYIGETDKHYNVTCLHGIYFHIFNGFVFGGVDWGNAHDPVSDWKSIKRTGCINPGI